ncbi:MAG: GNAT family N-acetyltransferase [Alphaproteobacteria bacterium]|nr:GNAT family N-acetyltransferase [Alphaproteobacteria bacterium]
MTDTLKETPTLKPARFIVPAGIATLETARLMLRPLVLTDADWVARESGRPEVANTLALVPAPNPSLFAEMFILTVLAKPADIVRAVIDRASGEPLGVIGAHHKGEGVYGFGYWYGPAAWGRGIATEAGAALRDALREAGAARLTAGYFTTNKASARVLEKLGFEHTGDDEPQFCIAQMKALPHRGMALDL